MLGVVANDPIAEVRLSEWRMTISLLMDSTGKKQRNFSEEVIFFTLYHINYIVGILTSMQGFEDAKHPGKTTSIVLSHHG
jgi:hypothetical protein